MTEKLFNKERKKCARECKVIHHKENREKFLKDKIFPYTNLVSNAGPSLKNIRIMNNIFVKWEGRGGEGKGGEGRERIRVG